LYKEKHDLLLEQLRPFLKDFELSGEHAGLHVLLKSKRGLTEWELVSRAAEMGVKVYPMSEAYITTEESTRPETHTVILGYGNLSPEQIREGISLLKKAFFD